MRFVLCATVIALLTAAVVPAQVPPGEAQAPLAAAYRDAQRLAACMKALDAPCVVALSNVHSYQVLGGDPDFNFAKAQTRFFDGMKREGWGFSVFAVSLPRDLYVDGGRLYAFVPYSSTSNFGGRTSTNQAFLTALSNDGGENWTFVTTTNSEQVQRIIPGYTGQPLPPVVFIDGAKNN
jgi:hypothetical protein